MDPTTTAHSSAIHHSQIQASTAADGTPILTTGHMTPSLDFDPSGFKRADTGLGPSLSNPYTNPAPLVPDNSSSNQFSSEHSNPHPVVAKTGVDVGSGTARPAETHANTSSVSSSANHGASTTGANVPHTSSTNSTGVTGSAPTVTGLRQRAGSITNTVGAKVNAVGNNVSAQLNSVGNSVGNQLNHAAEHPAVQNAKQGAVQQVNSFREVLGRYPIIVNAEKRTGVDRVALVAGGVLAYLLLIPFNLFGLALPTTQLLTFLPPTFLALRTLDSPNEERTKTLLSYFVVFGFVQFAESLMAGFLERRIPQYYTVKLLFLAYLIHPRTKGARKIHAQVLRPLLVQAQQAQKHSAHSASYNTPPTTKPSSGPTVNSPTFPAHSSTAADVPLTRTSGFSGTGPSSTGHAGAPASATSGSGFHSIDASGLSESGAQGFNVGSGQIHLPSGGGNGVGQEVPKY